MTSQLRSTRFEARGLGGFKGFVGVDCKAPGGLISSARGAGGGDLFDFRPFFGRGPAPASPRIDTVRVPVRRGDGDIAGRFPAYLGSGELSDRFVFWLNSLGRETSQPRGGAETSSIFGRFRGVVGVWLLVVVCRAGRCLVFVSVVCLVVSLLPQHCLRIVAAVRRHGTTWAARGSASASRPTTSRTALSLQGALGRRV